MAVFSRQDGVSFSNRHSGLKMTSTRNPQRESFARELLQKLPRAPAKPLINKSTVPFPSFAASPKNFFQKFQKRA